jgi:rhamnose utilization protein RhaD (predicted bifunctional aldolase and dehydrogenase)
MDELAALRKLSAEVGFDPLLVQAAGGNTSLKDDSVMWIKASGTWLKDAAARDIFVPVDHPALMAAIAEDDPRCEACTDFLRTDLNATSLRPSIETTVHALMPQRVVLHVHCVNTIAYAICTDGKERLQHVLKDFHWTWIPYARPGRPLAAVISQRMQPDVNVLVLGNHGLVVAADTVEQAEHLLHRVVRAVQRPVREKINGSQRELDGLCAGTDYRVASDPETHALATDALALPWGHDKVLYPDHAVFLGVGVATELSSNEPLVAIPGVGVVIRHDVKSAIEPMGRCLADVMRRVSPDDQLVTLAQNDIGALLNWDAEKYRQTLKVT